MCVFECVYVYHIHAAAHRGQKRVLDPSEPEFVTFFLLITEDFTEDLSFHKR